MNPNLTFKKTYIVRACMVLALLLCGCSKSAPDATKDALPAKDGRAKPVAQSSPSKPSVEVAETDAALAAVKILNTAHRNGSVTIARRVRTERD